MQVSVNDKQTLRRLAERYSEIGHMDVQKERMDRYYRTNALENVRPVVLIDEVPWGEIKDSTLTNVCAPGLGWIESPPGFQTQNRCTRSSVKMGPVTSNVPSPR